MSKSVLKFVLPLIVLLAGAGATAALISSRQAPAPEVRPALGPLVETTIAQPTDLTVSVDSQGEVGAAVRVEVLAEVSGRVIQVHPRLVAGGRIPAGATLARIDPRDYQLAVESARAAIASAETRLEQERAEAAAALNEWRQVNGDTPAPTLLIREPQIRQIQAEKAAAEAQLARAELDLERTQISVPFDAIVLSESVDRGQFLNVGRVVASLYGTNAVEIRVPLDDAELRWFDLPSAQSKPSVTVSADFAGSRNTWPGVLDRLEGQVDPQTRLVHVIARVADPFAQEPPLLPGTFVDVSIDGRALEGVFQLPRFALRTGGVVWVVDDGALRFRDVEVLRTDRSSVFISSGLEVGEHVVISSLDGVTDGMTVRIDSRGEEP
ncbi:MAG: efflux RND transporter periplasmic adaptor subunit [Acidobacteriota bacterium]